jgi:hypothetical protein
VNHIRRGQRGNAAGISPSFFSFPCQSPFTHCPILIYHHDIALIRQPVNTSLVFNLAASSLTSQTLQRFSKCSSTFEITVSGMWRRVVCIYLTRTRRICCLHIEGRHRKLRNCWIAKSVSTYDCQSVTTQKFIIWELTNQNAWQLILWKTAVGSRTLSLRNAICSAKVIWLLELC